MQVKVNEFTDGWICELYFLGKAMIKMHVTDTELAALSEDLRAQLEIWKDKGVTKTKYVLLYPKRETMQREFPKYSKEFDLGKRRLLILAPSDLYYPGSAPGEQAIGVLGIYIIVFWGGTFMVSSRIVEIERFEKSVDTDAYLDALKLGTAYYCNLFNGHVLDSAEVITKAELDRENNGVIYKRDPIPPEPIEDDSGLRLEVKDIEKAFHCGDYWKYMLITVNHKNMDIMPLVTIQTTAELLGCRIYEKESDIPANVEAMLTYLGRDRAEVLIHRQSGIAFAVIAYTANKGKIFIDHLAFRKQEGAAAYKAVELVNTVADGGPGMEIQFMDTNNDLIKHVCPGMLMNWIREFKPYEWCYTTKLSNDMINRIHMHRP